MSVGEGFLFAIEPGLNLHLSGSDQMPLLSSRKKLPTRAGFEPANTAPCLFGAAATACAPGGVAPPLWGL